MKIAVAKIQRKPDRKVNTFVTSADILTPNMEYTGRTAHRAASSHRTANANVLP